MFNLILSSSQQLGESNFSEKPKGLQVIACIPAYNVEKTIAKTILLVQKYVDQIIVCDDGSQDMTGQIASELGAIVIKHPENMGYGAALATLFSAALRIEADFMVTIDGDGQHDPAQIPRLLEPLKDGKVDLVVGSRFRDKDDLDEVPGYRKFGLEMINGLTKKLSYDQLTDSQSGFRAYDRKAIKMLRPSEQGMGASTEILLKASKAGLVMEEISAKITYGDGSSTHNPITHGISVILSTVKQMSMRRPLFFYGLPGLISVSIALVFWVWTLQIFTETRAIVTNIALIALSATMVGLMLMMTAVILWVVLSAVREKT